MVVRFAANAQRKMSDEQRENLARWADLIYKIGVPLG